MDRAAASVQLLGKRLDRIGIASVCPSSRTGFFNFRIESATFSIIGYASRLMPSLAAGKKAASFILTTRPRGSRLTSSLPSAISRSKSPVRAWKEGNSSTTATCAALGFAFSGTFSGGFAAASLF